MNQTPREFLRGLAERIMAIPVKHNVDQGDHDELRVIASGMDPGDEGTDPVADFATLLHEYLIDTLRLSEVKHPDVFKKEFELVRELRNALDHVRWHARKSERERVKEIVMKEIR